MTAMFQSLTFIITLIFLKPIISFSQSCEEIYLYGYNNTVQIKLDGSTKSDQCKWIISPPENTITSLSVFESRLDRCYQPNSCCLTISDSQVFCNNQLANPIILSFKIYPITLVLDTSSQIELQFEYSSRQHNQCPQTDFQCLDKSNCFNSIDRCSDKVICKDYSDKRGCGICSYNSTWCGTNFNHCFELTQRCDGIFNCPKGEDELACYNDCQGIKCPREQKCITQYQICDDTVDCMTGFDESNCSINALTKSFNTIMTFFICSTCSILFVCLIYRWMATRRDLHRVLQNLPEFPLPPFHGPGDQDDDTIHSSELLDADIRPGGDLYESYVAAIKKRTVSTKSVQAGEAKYNQLELDGDNELVVLASLGVPVNLCVGLTVSEESILSLANSRTSANSGGGDQQNNFKNRTKTVLREHLELADEKRKLVKTVKSAPVSSKHRASNVVSGLPSTSLNGNHFASSDLTGGANLKTGSKSDSRIIQLCESSAKSTQILVNPYAADQISDSNQWTDIEEFDSENSGRRFKDTYEYKRKNLKKRVGLRYKI